MTGTPPIRPQRHALPRDPSSTPQGQGSMRGKRKSPWLAAVLGLLIVGLGLMYVGKWWEGIALFVLGLIGSVLTGFVTSPIFRIISGAWAYYAAVSYNRKAGYAG